MEEQRIPEVREEGPEQAGGDVKGTSRETCASQEQGGEK